VLLRPFPVLVFPPLMLPGASIKFTVDFTPVFIDTVSMWVGFTRWHVWVVVAVVRLIIV
jgi:hypothetical protein